MGPKPEPVTYPKGRMTKAYKRDHGIETWDMAAEWTAKKVGKPASDLELEEPGSSPDIHLSLAERKDVREYLESLQPEKVKALKNKSPDEYRAILKSMVRKLFPDGADIQFRKEGKVIDYDHLLSDRTREEYIHTLPQTIRRGDIKLEFRNGDIDKEILIKKYFDEDIQKDIWDIVVLHNNEIRTKIARKGKRGRVYVESVLVRDRSQASVRPTPAEDKESASTRTEDTEEKIAGSPTEDKGEKEGGGGPDISYSLKALERIADTPEFKKWFAGSKVVDEQGEPAVVYRGADRTDARIMNTLGVSYFS
jgi:hypothetical protein